MARYAQLRELLRAGDDAAATSVLGDVASDDLAAEGREPLLLIAIEHGCIAAAESLLVAARVDPWQPVAGDATLTSVHSAAELPPSRTLRVARAMVASGASLQHADCGSFLAHACRRRGQLSTDRGETRALLDFLLQHGCTVEDTGVDGAPPLLLAAEAGNAEAVAWLLGRGAAVDRSLSGQTALHVAANAPITRALLEAGADPAARDAEGCTALHYAAGLQ
jgi:ankyrin repeat protein